MSTVKFNKEQIDAITFGEGPLLVVAGAGTGKTTVITERIKHLILEKKIPPDSILALTFTEKASNEMQERIDKLMPYGYTQMWISTFHSFCDSFLRSEGLEIGISSSYRLMTEGEATFFLKKNIFKLDLSYYRPLGNPTKFLEALLQHFSRLRDEDVAPDEYLSYAKSLEEGLTKKDLEQAEKDDIQKTLELARAYSQYEKLKEQENVMDFSDLIAKTLRLLRTRKNVLKRYQDKFQYILVDEFQDTNFAQNELAILLSGKRQNITVVADDDQAIYRWRGAALSNVIQFNNNFPGAKTITLVKNYRSTQEILDRAYQMIQHNNPDRLEVIQNVNKKLVSERKKTGAPVEFLLSRKIDEETEEIAKKILEVKEKKKYHFSDFAILVRANNHAQAITQTLSRRKIPYQFLGPGQLFQQDEIRDLISYLKLLYNLEDSVSLFRVLNMEIFGINSRDISFLLSFARRKSISLFEALEQGDQSFLNEASKEKIKTFTTMVSRHLERVKKDSGGQILYYFLVDSGLYSRFISFQSAREEQIAQNVAKFFDRIKTFELTNPESDLFTVVDWLELLMEMGESPLATELDWKDVDAVNILTVHSSKGLEFPVVFLPNLVVDRFPTRERREKIPVPKNLIKEFLPEGDYHLQEERRLFYVGMTRAKDVLFLTAASFYGEGKREKKISPFVYEAVPEYLKKEKEAKKSTQLSLLEVTRDYETVQEETVEKKAPYKVSSLSFSQLQTFDICPLHYKARYILNLPTPSFAALSFGVSIHAALKDFYDLNRIMRSDPSGEVKVPTLPEFLSLLRKDWISEGYQEKAHEKNMFQLGEKILTKYYHESFDPKNIPLSLELPFSFYLTDTVKITGKIDRIDRGVGRNIEIIDYKTGQSDHAYKKTYEMQLGMYALAATRVNHEFLKRKPEEITVSLFYLEDGEKISKIESDEELAKIEETLKEKIHEIETSDFSCSKSVLCMNCEYKMLCNVNS